MRVWKSSESGLSREVEALVDAVVTRWEKRGKVVPENEEKERTWLSEEGRENKGERKGRTTNSIDPPKLQRKGKRSSRGVA